MNKEKSYVVYKHINKINKKEYIGITCQNPPNRRWQNGLGYDTNQYFGKAIKKYCWDNFEHVILFSGLTSNEAKEKEKELIAEARQRLGIKNCYNLSDGGDMAVQGLKIYCIETEEVFSSPEDALEKQPHYKSTTSKDILDCCNHKTISVKRPWIKDGQYHYQFYSGNVVDTLEDIKEKFDSRQFKIKRREEIKKMVDDVIYDPYFIYHDEEKRYDEYETISKEDYTYDYLVKTTKESEYDNKELKEISLQCNSKKEFEVAISFLNKIYLRSAQKSFRVLFGKECPNELYSAMLKSCKKNTDLDKIYQESVEQRNQWYLEYLQDHPDYVKKDIPAL